MCQLDEHM